MGKFVYIPTASELLREGRCSASCLVAYGSDNCDCICGGQYHGSLSESLVMHASDADRSIGKIAPQDAISSDNVRTSRQRTSQIFLKVEDAENNASSHSEDCAEWLSDWIETHGGVCKSTDVLSAARAEGFTDYQIAKSKRELAVTSRRQRDYWEWQIKGARPIERVAKLLRRKVRSKPGISECGLRRSLNSRDRFFFEDAIEFAIEQKWLLRGGLEGGISENESSTVH